MLDTEAKSNVISLTTGFDAEHISSSIGIGVNAFSDLNNRAFDIQSEYGIEVDASLRGEFPLRSSINLIPFITYNFYGYEIDEIDSGIETDLYALRKTYLACGLSAQTMCMIPHRHTPT